MKWVKKIGARIGNMLRILRGYNLETKLLVDLRSEKLKIRLGGCDNHSSDARSEAELGTNVELSELKIYSFSRTSQH